MTIKYQNGMYKTTSKKQDNISRDVYQTLYDIGVGRGMSIDFNQVTGNCEFKYKIEGQTCVYVITLDRAGNVIERAWEG